MTTSRLLIITATAFALAAPTASASPAADPATARPHQPQASNPASIIAHKDQYASEQFTANQRSSAKATALTDRTQGSDDSFPTVFVLFGIAIPLTLAVAMIAAKPVRAYAHSRRGPARVA